MSQSIFRNLPHFTRGVVKNADRMGMSIRPGQLQTAGRIVLGPLFKLAWRVRTEGLHHLPSGGALIAPNHTSVLDSFFVPLVLPRRITYVGKAEYMDDWKTKVLFPGLGMIPIDRSGGAASTAALDAAASVLERDELFGIYPEGTRSRSGLLYKGHTGAARLALRTGKPIIPVGIIGAREVQPPDTRLPRPFMEVLIRFGPPVAVDRYADRASDRLVLRQITDEVMFEIQNLTGQEYVDEYATKRHETIPAEPAVLGPKLGAIMESGAGTGRSSGSGGRPDANADTGDSVGERSSAAVLASRPLVDLVNL